MNKLFYKDPILGVEFSYDQFFSDLVNETVYNPYCKTDSYYVVFKQIILSLILGKEIILLDSDFSETEVEQLIGQGVDISNNSIQIEPVYRLEYYDFVRRILEKKDSWKITLFTSGTTGLPKKVSHSFDSISRFVKMDEKRKDNIWGFAYNPTHMAGIQVFFQALLNQNTIIRLFGVDRDYTLELINNYKITNVSATPTFYRLLLPADHICESIRNLTSGGEKFDANTLELLHKMFPNGMIRNVYASTEAGTLFASDGNIFTIKSKMLDLVKVVENELYLHSSLMGDLGSLKLEDEWYKTGDIIEVLNENPFSFKFVSRKTEMINTGGYKVNPTDIEEIIRLCPGVKDAFVFGKKNSLLGNIVSCEVIRSDQSLTEKNIREYLQEKLQEYKIPRIVKFVENLTTTRTGKISRK